MKITSRAQWNARPPKNPPTHVDPTKRTYFVVHYSGAPATQTVRAIQDWCMDGRGFSDVDYNHLVRATTGEIYEGRGFDVVGAHTTGFNTNGVGVCVIGDGPISDAAKRSALWLYGQYNTRCKKALKIRGHRDLATTGTACPGDTIQAWLRAGMPAPGPTPKPEDDVTEAQLIAAVTKALDTNKVLADVRDKAAKLQAAVTTQGRILAALAEKDHAGTQTGGTRPPAGG